MPSSMVHLMTAREYFPDASAEFWVGSGFAPDCITGRDEREHFHFRDKADREPSLIKFAGSIEKGDFFAMGMLLHLFTDWKWDWSLLQRYIKNHNSGDWYKSYHDEVGILSARLYHDNPWIAEIWYEMEKCDIAALIRPYKEIDGDILSMIKRTDKFHKENPSAEPAFYSMGEAISFAAVTAEDFRGWLGGIGVRG